MKSSDYAYEILELLESRGFEAYFVGGCVRDMFMGRTAHDYDITTNALPEEIKEVFSDFDVIPTGLKHGTVTVMNGGIPFEVTTYRVDGDYSDSRRPDSVRFTSDIEQDLARRDFTINAIAMNRNGSVIDPFGGKNDIEKHIIRCVGEPEKRFSEDALRIIRAVRFAAQLDCVIESATSRAVHSMKNSLDIISRERIRDEIDKLICGTNCLDVLLEYSDVISVVIPEFADCVGFDQRSDYHKYDVWEHIIRAMILSPPDNLLLRRALFFHDIGKPACATYDEQGKGHFKGHDTISADMTEIIMKRLKYDKKSIHDTAEIIRYHRFKGNTKPAVKKMLNILGDRLFFELIELKKCDNQAKNHFVRRENDDLDIASAVAHEILSSGECFSVSQLAVDGNDLIQHGVQGVEIGEMLDEILELVIDEKIPNDRTEILNFIRQR